MKKIFVLFFVLILIASSFSYKLVFEKDFSDATAVYAFYTLGECENIANSVVIKNGNSSIVKVEKNYAKQVRRNLTNVVGESVSFNGNKIRFSVIKDKLNANYIIDETVENEIIIFSGFSKVLGENAKCVNLNGKLINFQIAYNKGVITIGTPVILGDY